MKNLPILYYSLFIMLIWSCSTANNKHEEVEKTTLVPEILNDAVITKFPGNFHINNKYAVLENLFSNGFFLQIYDLNTGEKLGNAGVLGRGPLEFTTPTSEFIKDDSLYVYDLNRDNHAGFYSIKSAISGNNAFNALQNVNNHGVTQVIMVDDNTYIFMKPGTDELFTVMENGVKKTSFGSNPIKANISNGNTVFLGIISYHPEKELLVYTVSNFPYLAIYKKNADNFVLLKEVGVPSSVEITGDKLVLDRKKRGIESAVLTKDYIVCHQRDYSVDNTDESTIGRNFSLLPKTVFLYSYDGELKKIIDLSYPVIRIAANPDSNELYAVILNEEFQIVKYSM